jgi:hypothetical protein
LFVGHQADYQLNGLLLRSYKLKYVLIWVLFLFWCATAWWGQSKGFVFFLGDGLGGVLMLGYSSYYVYSRMRGRNFMYAAPGYDNPPENLMILSDVSAVIGYLFGLYILFKSA